MAPASRCDWTCTRYLANRFTTGTGMFPSVPVVFRECFIVMPIMEIGRRSQIEEDTFRLFCLVIIQVAQIVSRLRTISCLPLHTCVILFQSIAALNVRDCAIADSHDAFNAHRHAP